MAQHAQSFEFRSQRVHRLDYLLSMPADGAADRRWPLLLFLHGAGERAGNGIGLDAVKKHGVPKRLERKNTLPFIVVSPQCPQDHWWPEYDDVLIALVDEIIAQHPVDPQRIYVTGLSMGGFGTWTLAALHPERFAAAAPVCGGLPWHLDVQRAAQAMKTLPIWAFHGAKDDVVPLAETRRVVDALKQAGSHPKLTVYREAQHDSWTKTYANPKLYQWFLEHQLPR